MKHFTWYLNSDNVFKHALKIILKRLIFNDNSLTPDYLISKGWNLDTDGYYFEPYVKNNYNIWIKFITDKTYNVYLGEKKTFYCTSSTIEWFELFYLLQHPDNGRYDLIEL